MTQPPRAMLRDAARARWLLWLAFWTMLASIAIGLSWDAALAAVALMAPFLSGAVDIFLRFRTPWT